MSINNSENIKPIFDRCCFERCKKLVQCKYSTVTSHKLLFEGKCDFFQVILKSIE